MTIVSTAGRYAVQDRAQAGNKPLSGAFLGGRS